MTRTKALVLLHHDGLVEVFGHEHLDCHIVNVPAMDSPAGEIKAEEYVELTIPRPYREVYFPGYRRGVELLRKTLPSDIAYRQWSVELLHQIQSIGGAEC